MIQYRLLVVLLFPLALGLVSPCSFAATPALRLDYPNGGETFVAGTAQQVALGPKLKAILVNIELSLDGGATFTALGSIAVVKSVASPLSFIVPNTPSGNCVIRVSGSVKGAPVSAASRTFAIASAGTSVPSGLADGSVTNPKLAARAVSSDKVTSGPASSDFVLTADGIGNAVWKTLPASASNNGLAGGDLTGTYPNPAIECALSHTPKGETRDGVEKALSLQRDLSIATAASLLGNGCKVISQDAVPLCLWCAARHLNNYVEAMWTTVAALGDRDTTCAIVGGIVALASGESVIPNGWLSAREPLDYESAHAS